MKCNFNKGLGPDGFDWNLLKSDPEVANKLFDSIISWLASGQFPKYLSDGRIVLLSKDNKDFAEVSNTKPIVVTSHITKLIVKTIVIRLEKMRSTLLNTGSY
jgi:hypothetical protein